MTRFAVLALLALACLAASSSASAATTSSPRCVYKMVGQPGYVKFGGVLTAGVCDAVGESANGAVVKVYGPPVGRSRCAFALTSSGLTAQMYSNNDEYGRFMCKWVGKSLTADGWRKLF